MFDIITKICYFCSHYTCLKQKKKLLSVWLNFFISKTFLRVLFNLDVTNKVGKRCPKYSNRVYLQYGATIVIPAAITITVAVTIAITVTISAASALATAATFAVAITFAVIAVTTSVVVVAMITFGINFEFMSYTSISACISARARSTRTTRSGVSSTTSVININSTSIRTSFRTANIASRSNIIWQADAYNTASAADGVTWYWFDGRGRLRWRWRARRFLLLIGFVRSEIEIFILYLTCLNKNTEVYSASCDILFILLLFLVMGIQVDLQMSDPLFIILRG